MINPSKSEIIPHTRVSSQAQIETNYEIGEKIGQGSFGKVFAVTEKSSGIKWAMKCLHKVEKSVGIELLEREIAILKIVQHENIIKLKEVFETHDKVFLIMEYCGGGELADELVKVKKYSELEVKNIMASLASAIAYLHKSDIVHRDLKLANILLSDNPLDDKDHLFIKVTDFGLSVIQGGVGHESMMNTFCGSLIYMAPEVLENKTYSQQCDVWAMGIIAYQLICGIPPFMSDDEEALMDLIRAGDFDFYSPEWDDITDDAKNCIQNMLHLDTAYRLTAAEVMQHSWFTGMTQEDRTQPGNILELMSHWKDDLIKDHLKDDIDDQTESQEEEVEEVEEDDEEEEKEEEKSETASEGSQHVKKKKKTKSVPMRSNSKDTQEVPERTRNNSLPESSTSGSSTDKACKPETASEESDVKKKKSVRARSSSKETQEVAETNLNRSLTESSLPESSPSRSPATDKAFASKSLLGRSNKSLQIKPPAENKNKSLIGQNSLQTKPKKL